MQFWGLSERETLASISPLQMHNGEARDRTASLSMLSSLPPILDIRWETSTSRSSASRPRSARIGMKCGLALQRFLALTPHASASRQQLRKSLDLPAEAKVLRLRPLPLYFIADWSYPVRRMLKIATIGIATLPGLA